MRHPKLLILLAVLMLPWGCDRTDVSAIAEAQPEDEPRWTSPPGPDTPEVQALLARVGKTLESGAADVSAVLTDPAWLPLHERTSFRELIASHAKSSRVKIVTPKEPGDRMVVTGMLRQADGRPLAGALVYVYQTDAKGWYSDRAPHFSGGNDHDYARLFGYLKTGPDGRFEVDTIRPDGYPQSSLPQHIHIQVFVDGQSRLVSEVTFEDDPRMTPSMRRQVERNGFYLVPVEHGADGVQRCRVEIAVR